MKKITQEQIDSVYAGIYTQYLMLISWCKRKNKERAEGCKDYIIEVAHMVDTFDRKTANLNHRTLGPHKVDNICHRAYNLYRRTF